MARIRGLITITASNGGMLSAEKLWEFFESIPDQPDPPVVWLTAKTIKVLRGKNPEYFKEFEKRMECSWQQLGEDLDKT